MWLQIENGTFNNNSASIVDTLPLMNKPVKSLSINSSISDALSIMPGPLVISDYSDSDDELMIKKRNKAI
jgi:hypothetical protein